MSLQDGSVGYIVQGFLGDFGVRLVYIAVTISILGSINGLILGYIRLPYSLAIRDEFPRSDLFKMVNVRSGISAPSAFFALFMVMIWSILHFMSVMDFKLGAIHFSGLQIDSLPIVLTYLFYGSLYLKIVVEFIRRREGTLVNGIIYPCLALFGASLMLYGGLSDPQAAIYFVISFVGIASGLLIRPKRI